ncbi:MAG: hypothetical protein ABI330_21805 [Caldimonas sp.]
MLAPAHGRTLRVPWRCFVRLVTRGSRASPRSDLRTGKKLPIKMFFNPGATTLLKSVDLQARYTV